MERKEAIEIVKKYLPNNGFTISREALETLIPELQESEDEDDDDGIRKDLIEFVQQYGDNFYGQFSKASAISWLERQGKSSKTDMEYRPHKGDADNPYDMSFEDAQQYAGERGIDASINDGDVFVDERYITQTIGNILRWADEHPKIQKKAEPKFKVGDWIAGEGVYTAKIINIDDDEYEVEFSDGSKGLHLIDFIYKFYHLWTINDAKDGDVVVDKFDGAIGMFRSIGHHPDGGSYNDPSYCFLHCRYDNGFFYTYFENGNTIDTDDLIPATKKQQDLLFQKITEAGYEWDAENKVLRKQGKQESANKVEPKFKVGDWIVANDGINTNNGTNTFLITNINCNHCSSGDVGIISIYCALEDTEGVTHYPCLLSENFFHRWTIEDVRDGDILVDEDNNIGIYKEKDDLNLNWGSYIYLGCDNRLRGFSIGGYHKIKNTKPATKEQRKLLFQNLGQVGYEWDSDEKRLKNIMEW